jgi:hypothetical protein
VIDPRIFDGDPAVREDGLCFICLKPRRPERSKKYARAIAERDPFCSSTCARTWHENPIPDLSIWGRPRRLENNEAA